MGTFSIIALALLHQIVNLSLLQKEYPGCCLVSVNKYLLLLRDTEISILNGAWLAALDIISLNLPPN